MGIVAIATTIINTAELIGNVAETIKKLDKFIPEPPKVLQEKHRWIQCTVVNETEFTILLQGSYFDSGKYWDSPKNIKPFDMMVFSASNGDHTIMTGVSGGTSFRASLDSKHYYDFAIGWTSPQFGAIKSGVAQSHYAQAGYNNATATGNTIQSTHQYEGKDHDGHRVRLHLQISAVSGNNSATFTITEVRVLG